MAIEPQELDSIKTAVADSLAHNSVAPAAILDALKAIDLAAGDDTDPRPFAVGKRVTSQVTGVMGTVARRVEHEGELHTVVVAWDGAPGEWPVSPREIAEVA